MQTFNYPENVIRLHKEQIQAKIKNLKFTQNDVQANSTCSCALRTIFF